MKNLKKFIDLNYRLFKKHNLDLSEKIILTEASNGNYSSLSILSIMAGAQVYAYAKDSSYGSIEEVKNFFCQVKKMIDLRNFNLVEKLDKNLIGKADIITNSGHLRPIGREMIDNISPKSVVSLMMEPWEIGKQHLDLAYLKEKRILYAGVDEKTKLNTFEYVGLSALKLLLNNGIEILGSKIGLLGSHQFNQTIEKYLLNNGAEIYNLSADKVNDDFYKLDCIIFTEFNDWSPIEAQFPNVFRHILEMNKTIFCISGNTGDYSNVIPADYEEGKMRVRADYIGAFPAVELCCGGLKVGQILHDNLLKYSDVEKAKWASSKSGYCLF